MSQTIPQKTIVDYVQIVKRRKWPVIITVISLFVVSVLVAALIPAVYRATAVILIEQQDIPSEMVQSTITSFADQRIQVISQRVMTTTNLTKVMDKYELYKEEREKYTREEVIENMRDNISLNMISAEVIDPRSGRPTEATIAFKLAYENRSPELSQKVTNELVSLYLNENLKSRTEKAAEATGFLTEEASRLRNQIEEMEKELAEFKENKSGSLPELASLNMNLLERTEREFFEVERQISSIEERKIYLEAQLNQINPAATVFSESGERILTPQGKLKAIETRYISASAIYAEDHPDLVRMRKELTSLRNEVGSSMQSKDEIEKQIKGLVAKLATMDESHSKDHPDVKRLENKISKLQQVLFKLGDDEQGSTHLSADNPAYVQLKVSLESAETDLNSLQKKHRKLKKKLHEIEDRIVQAPQVEREYLSMTRDYNNAVIKYKEITTKEMSAKLAEELERGSKGERFSLIEPPLLPEKPVKPNRKAIIVLGFILSLGAGVGLIFILNAIDKSIQNHWDIISVIGMQPLATIPYIVTDEEISGSRQSRLIFLLSSLASFLLVFVVIHYLYKPIDVLWFVISRKLGF